MQPLIGPDRRRAAQAAGGCVAAASPLGREQAGRDHQGCEQREGHTMAERIASTDSAHVHGQASRIGPVDVAGWTFTAQAPSRSDVEGFFTATSAASRRDRFHLAVKVMPDRELTALLTCPVDRLNVFAWVADVPAVIAGVGTGVMVSPTRAEVALWIVDDCQGRGLGSRLLLELSNRLLARGVRQLEAFVDPSNTAAMRLLDHVHPARGRAREGVVHARWRIGPEPQTSL